MCNLSYEIEERGILQGIEKERIQNIQNMLLDHLPVNKIKQYTNATDEEIKKAEEALGVR